MSKEVEREYSGTCIIQLPLENGKQCRIIEVSLYSIKLVFGARSRILASLRECWFVEVPDEAGSIVFEN